MGACCVRVVHGSGTVPGQYALSHTSQRRRTRAPAGMRPSRDVVSSGSALAPATAIASAVAAGHVDLQTPDGFLLTLRRLERTAGSGCARRIVHSWLCQTRDRSPCG